MSAAEAMDYANLFPNGSNQGSGRWRGLWQGRRRLATRGISRGRPVRLPEGRPLETRNSTGVACPVFFKRQQHGSSERTRPHAVRCAGLTAFSQTSYGQPKRANDDECQPRELTGQASIPGSDRGLRGWIVTSFRGAQAESSASVRIMQCSPIRTTAGEQTSVGVGLVSLKLKPARVWWKADWRVLQLPSYSLILRCRSQDLAEDSTKGDDAVH
jgi:hypothetical protein